MPRSVFVTGGTGYIGKALLLQLVDRGHKVRALVRRGSESKITVSCDVCLGDALDGSSYRRYLAGCDTFVHLVGVPHPSPAKARQFVEVDQRSGEEAIRAAVHAATPHFVYLSVAHPAPVMKAYWHARKECETFLRESGLNATIVRPWYVLGRGHSWPVLLKPFYRFAEFVPSMREGAARLGLVNLQEMIQTLITAVEQPPDGIRVLDVPHIHRLGSASLSSAADSRPRV